MPNDKGPRPIDRRTFLRGLAFTSGGVLLAACGQAAAPAAESPSAAPATGASPTAPAAAATSASVADASTTVAAATTAPAANATAAPVTTSGKLTIMVGTNQLSDDMLKTFLASNPGLQVERVDPDPTKLKAMFAAGTPPDLFAGSGAQVPTFANRGLVLDLSPYFARSSLLKADDMAPPINYWKYNGGWYGMNQDWSPDQSTLINVQAFADAGITPPEPKKLFTYQNMAEWAKKLTKAQGNKTERVGWAYSGYWDGSLQTILMEDGQDLYSEDFKQAKIKDNPRVVEVLTYFANLAKDGAIWSAINPSPSWGGEDITKGRAAMYSTGYWMHGVIAGTTDSPVPADKLQLFPAPSWSGKKAVNPALGGAGWFISKASKNPDAAWQLFEYYMGGQPAQTRAKSGFGLPALKSLFSLVPQEKAFDKQFFDEAMWEIQNTDQTPRRLNPYIETATIGKSWESNLEKFLKGESTIEQAIEALDADVNSAIQDGISAV